MQIPFRRRLAAPMVLAAAGAACAALAVADKFFGLVQRPLHLATLAYAFLFILVAWGFLRGIPVRPQRLVRLSVYAALLLVNLLTAAYVFAWRLSADPTPVLLQAQLERADDLLEAGETDRAHLLYREAFRRYPRSFPVLMRMGAVAYRLSDYDRARKYFTRALEVAPPGSRWRALNDLGQAYWMLKKPGDAIELYERAESEGLPEGERIEWHYRLAWAHFDAGNLDAAIDHYLFVALAGQKYAAASFYNIACAQAQQLKDESRPAERRRLAREAVGHLRRAWAATDNADEKQAFREGLLGDPENRDPELEPLRGTPELDRFLASLRAG